MVWTEVTAQKEEDRLNHVITACKLTKPPTVHCTAKFECQRMFHYDLQMFVLQVLELLWA